MKELTNGDIVGLIVSILLSVGIIVYFVGVFVHLLLTVDKMEDFEDENNDKCP